MLWMQRSIILRKKNAALPKFIVTKVDEMLYKQDKYINGAKVAILGLAMKDYSNDDRTSPSIDICNLLIEKGAEPKEVCIDKRSIVNSVEAKKYGISVWKI